MFTFFDMDYPRRRVTAMEHLMSRALRAARIVTEHCIAFHITIQIRVELDIM